MSIITNGSSHHVRVVVRTKPTANFAQDLIKLEDDGKTVSVHLPKSWDQLQGYINNQQQDWSFKVDQVLHNTPQEEVYTTCAQEIVKRLMDGYNGTILAYGETGSGKTHTITGPIENYRLRGIIPRTISQVFKESKDRVESSITIRISYLEIYNETMFDLLSTLPDSNHSSARSSSSLQQLTISEEEQAVFVKGLTVRVASTEEEALSMLFEGEMNRTIAEHSLNKSSSRSHCIFTIHVESRSRTSSSTEYTVSKLNLVDLAGSERLSKTNSTGIVQKEAMYINKSLSFLEQVIVALADKNRDHIPYRQSKLTHVLKDSLGGNCSTLMIANIWVEADKIEETISTLRFAMRMMCVTNEPVQNILVDPRLLVKKYEQEIKTLKQELAMHDTLVNRTSISYEPLSEGQISDIQRHIHQFVEGTLQEIPIVTVQQINEVFAQFKAIIMSLEADKATQMKQPSLPAVLIPEPVSTKSSSPTYKQPKSRTMLSVEVSEDQQVGDTDGAGFGVGVAPSSLKHPSSPIAASKKTKAAKKITSAAPAEAKRIGSAQTKGSGSPVPSVEEPAMEKSQQEPSGEPRPSTPPTRSEAFEDFKKGRGSEINKILLTNKETLSQKKRESHDLSTSINSLKRRIDEVRDFLNIKDHERSEQGCAITTESGEPIIEEQEFKALAELKTLKAQYHSQYGQLQARQAEMQYCKQYIDQCRDRLLCEFDVWYTKSFLGVQQGPACTDGEIPKAKQDGVESDQEKFDQLQAALLKGDPATTAFYNALLRTEKRVYQAAAVKRRPGQLATSVRTKPPGVMTFT